jgi:ubiquinone/menaquinone biosynthesis C-methylase UbiE
MFAELGHAVTGIDLSPRMIDRARRKAEQAGQRIDFRVSDAAAVDVADGSFDLVVARHVIWTLPDPEQAVAEWLRILSPDGRLALIEGRWGDEDGSAQDVPPTPSQRAVVVDVTAALVRHGRQISRRIRNRRYRHIAERLPFFGGAPPERLAEFLGSNAVCDVEVEPLMDPALWREPPQFPRYLVTGTTRALRAAHDA